MTAASDAHSHDHGVSPGATSPDKANTPDTSVEPILKNPGNEEPELALEPDLPSDGPDELGNAMIRDLPVRPELSKSPERPE